MVIKITTYLPVNDKVHLLFDHCHPGEFQMIGIGGIHLDADYVAAHTVDSRTTTSRS